MKQPDSALKSYYKRRAPVYDRVYAYPERQRDLRFLEQYIPRQFVDLRVLEVAAGTGYWTQFLAREARSILATDTTRDALDQVANRPLARPVTTRIIDAYSLTDLQSRFQGAYAGLWLSHVPKQRLKEFLHGLHRCLEAGATVIFVDNSVAQCERLPISHTDESGNTFQDRRLDDGSVHRVLKNFPSQAELLAATADYGSRHRFMELEHFWLFQYVA